MPFQIRCLKRYKSANGETKVTLVLLLVIQEKIYLISDKGDPGLKDDVQPSVVPVAVRETQICTISNNFDRHYMWKVTTFIVFC